MNETEHITSERAGASRGASEQRAGADHDRRSSSPPRYGTGLADARAPGEALMSIQRKATAAAMSAPRSLPASGPGKAMPKDVRAKMEGAFGTDFSGVRIHEGPRATALGALAYTQGTNIHFAPGQYQPHSQPGQELLGHELTHVVQQAQGQVRATRQMKGIGVNDEGRLERAADAMGRRAASAPTPVSEGPAPTRHSGAAGLRVGAPSAHELRDAAPSRTFGQPQSTVAQLFGEPGDKAEEAEDDQVVEEAREDAEEVREDAEEAPRDPIVDKFEGNGLMVRTIQPEDAGLISEGYRDTLTEGVRMRNGTATGYQSVDCWSTLHKNLRTAPFRTFSDIAMNYMAFLADPGKIRRFVDLHERDAQSGTLTGKSVLQDNAGEEGRRELDLHMGRVIAANSKQGFNDEIQLIGFPADALVGFLFCPMPPRKYVLAKRGDTTDKTGWNAGVRGKFEEAAGAVRAALGEAAPAQYPVYELVPIAGSTTEFWNLVHRDNVS
ncbi:DUF4157 domain-containing protein [Haliangium sp.]|uniref:eCIS core domain-containing protein n=1 Tax=Haliangium sp. TaxID=2663208 RepID=UPI003D0CAF43